MKTTITAAIAKPFMVIFFVLVAISGYSQCTVITPGMVTGITNVCPYVGNFDTLTYTIEALPFATSYEWIVPLNVDIVSGQGTTVLRVVFYVNFFLQANKQIRVRALFPCGTRGYRIFYTVTQAPQMPFKIVQGSEDICGHIGTNNPISYTIPGRISATSYLWTTQAGTTTVEHPNGPGINDTIVLVRFAPGFTSSNISVAAYNDCGASASRTFALTINIPLKPAFINGATDLCENTSIPHTYAIPAVDGALTYSWNATAGAVITHPNPSGPNDTIITISYPPGYINGDILVNVTTACGTSGDRILHINRLNNPSGPGAISDVAMSVCPERIHNYSVAQLPMNSTSIQWTVPAGGNIVSGQGTTSITVSYTANAINGYVSAIGTSDCGLSVARTWQ